MKHILCICLSATIQRTITFENIKLACVNRSEHYRIDASGKAVNSARVLNMLEKGCALTICPLGKENKEPELLYRLGKRNPLMVLIDFISYSFFLLVPALPTAIYYDDWMRILGILGSALLIWLLYSVIFFNYVEIYRDKIVIDRYAPNNK